MSNLNLTDHAIIRMSQRGLGLKDFELMESIGTEVEGGFLIRKKDVRSLEQQLKSILHRAQRLEGKRLVVSGNTVVTAYHTTERKKRRLLRDTDDHSLGMTA